ncbi:MAG: hypothetical protein ACRD2D_06385 [Terriglobales bacterium]
MKFSLASSLALTGVMAFAAIQTLQPLNARTGQWNITETIHWSNIPAQYAGMFQNPHTITFTSCVKTENLTTNPFSNPGSKCQWTVLKSTGTDMEVQTTSCRTDTEAGPFLASIHGTIHMQDAQDGTGAMDYSGQIQGISAAGHADYTGTWAAPTCSSDNQ